MLFVRTEYIAAVLLVAFLLDLNIEGLPLKRYGSLEQENWEDEDDSDEGTQGLVIVAVSPSSEKMHCSLMYSQCLRSAVQTLDYRMCSDTFIQCIEMMDHKQVKKREEHERGNEKHLE